MGFIVKNSGMNKIQHSIIAMLTGKSVFTANDARKMGIHPSRLSYYVKIRLIERIARVVYRGVNSEMDVDFRWEDLVIIAKSVPNGVICLISALAIYDLTEEISRAHWIAIPHATMAPKREYTKFVRMRDMQTGVTKMSLGSEDINIFDRERTIVDAFRYLSLEIAIKALRAAVRTSKEHKLDLKKLRQYAKKFRLNLDPYIFAETT